MINREHIVRSVCVLALLALGITPALAKPDQPVFPKSWYTLPEEPGAALSMESDWPEDDPRYDAALSQSMRIITENHTSALSTFGERFKRQKRRHDHDGNWDIQAVMLGLSISGRGILGMDLIRGASASAELYWRPLASDTPPPVIPAAKPADITMMSAMSEADLRAQVEPIARAMKISGADDELEVIIDKILRKLIDFQALISTLDGMPEIPWWVSRVSFDLSLGASFKYQGVPIDGDVDITVDWLPNYSRVVAQSDLVRRHEFRKLVESIALDIASNDADLGDINGYSLKDISVGISYYARTNVGVGKGSASAGFTVYYSRIGSVGTPPPTQPEEPELTFDLVADEYTEADLIYARDNQIPYEITTNSETGLPEAIFKVTRKAFREGIKRSNFVASKMITYIDRWRRDPWQLVEARTRHSISIGGGLFVVKAGKRATVELFYRK